MVKADAINVAPTSNAETRQSLCIPLQRRLRFENVRMVIVVHDKGSGLAAYLIYTRQSLIDAEKNLEYIRNVGPVTNQFGGAVISAGAVAETLEGDLQLPPITLIRFPSIERLREWYDSSEYAPLKQLRLEATTGNMIIFEGA